MVYGVFSSSVGINRLQKKRKFSYIRVFLRLTTLHHENMTQTERSLSSLLAFDVLGAFVNNLKKICQAFCPIALCGSYFIAFLAPDL